MLDLHDHRKAGMEVSVEVDVEHLAGPCRVRVTSPIEAHGNEPFNHTLYQEMAVALNGQLAAVLTERDRLRYDDEQKAIRNGSITPRVRTADDHPGERIGD